MLDWVAHLIVLGASSSMRAAYLTFCIDAFMSDLRWILGDFSQPPLEHERARWTRTAFSCALSKNDNALAFCVPLSRNGQHSFQIQSLGRMLPAEKIDQYISLSHPIVLPADTQPSFQRYCVLPNTLS